MRNNILYRPWSELKAMRDKKLHSFITKKLYPFSPYYRHIFDKNKINPDKIRTAEDLAGLPFTSKKDFMAGEETALKNIEFILQPDEEVIRKYLPKKEIAKFLVTGIVRGKKYLKSRLGKEYRPIFLTATSGSTGEPISFFYSLYDLENLKISGKRIIDIFDIKNDERAVNMFPYAPHLAFWQTFFAGIASDMFVLSTGGGKTLGTNGNIRAILKVKPRFLIGIPSYVYHVLKEAREQNLDLSFLKRIALGASRVPKGFKKKISNLLSEMGSSDAQVLGTYGFTESRCAWGECPTEIGVSSGYHTYPDKEIFEIIDPDTGEVKDEGEDGEIVYTGIDARGSCVLRYRTGDLVKGGIVYQPCPHCGRTVPRISSDIVRASNIKDFQVTKVKGTLVNFNDLEHFLDDREEIDEWQVEMTKKNNDPFEVDELTLYMSLLRNVDEGEFSEALERGVFSISEVSFNRIHFVSKEEMHRRIEIETSVKAKKIVDKRPKS